MMYAYETANGLIELKENPKGLPLDLLGDIYIKALEKETSRSEEEALQLVGELGQESYWMTMTAKELQKNYTKKENNAHAKKLGIGGYTKMREKELTEAIYSTIHNPQ